MRAHKTLIIMIPPASQDNAYDMKEAWKNNKRRATGMLATAAAEGQLWAGRKELNVLVHVVHCVCFSWAGLACGWMGVEVPRPCYLIPATRTKGMDGILGIGNTPTEESRTPPHTPHALHGDTERKQTSCTTSCTYGPRLKPLSR
jgi:hypothetical protein